ncbi:MAG TPA: hypothetical protein VK591_19055 [Xanthobacteraceae bacterium]|nr:hypothetical protein [Xanthobacteraceae bacterium]
MALLLGACAGHHRQSDASGEDEGVNAYPTNYKTDILAAMHAYLNDPSAIRDASISEPAMKSESVFSHQRYMVCLRFNPKKTATVYEGMREVAAVFVGGRFDQFIETPKDLCAGATYAPFPELEKLAR